MKIFINAATLRVGGGRSVGVNFLSVLAKINLEDDFFAVVPNDGKYLSVLSGSFINYVVVPIKYHEPLKRLSLDHWILNKVEKYQPDVIYSMGNIALPIKHIRQVVLFHYPYAIYPESPVWKRLNWREYLRGKLVSYLFKKRLKFSDCLIVQTETAKKRITELYQYNTENISIVPNAVSLDSINEETHESEKINHFLGDKSKLKLLCLSYYYPHKNMEIFLEVGQQIKELGLQVQIVTTLNYGQVKEADRFLNKIKEKGLEEIIVNIGNIPMDEVPYLYQTIDALLLPTLLESFSGTYVEAMFYKKPILTSNLDFAVDVCGDYGIYFDPLSSKDIVEKIIKLQKMSNYDKIRYDKKRIEIFKNFHDWDKCTMLMLNLLK